jgi:hypothetical protein
LAFAGLRGHNENMKSDAVAHRAALERRVWRLAFLLTGDAAGAAALVDRVLDAQEDPAKLEPARVDRLVILQARELTSAARAKAGWAPRAEVADAKAKGTLEAALAMEHQPLEAWVLARVDDVDELWLSRAMDCSKTAARNHLNAADERMKSRLGEGYAAGVAALKKFADGLNAGPIIAQERAARRKREWRRRIAIGLVVATAVMGAGLIALRQMLGL